MRKSDASHAATVAVGIAAGADDKMLGHGAILEANAERSTRNAQSRIQIPDQNSRIIFESVRVDATVGSTCSGSDDNSTSGPVSTMCSGIEIFPRREIVRAGIDSLSHLRQFAESLLRFRHQKKGFARPS
jgi:hypothetical protein